MRSAPPDGANSVRLQVKVVPRAARSAITGWVGEALKVRLAAPPERGAANAALQRLLADALGLPLQRVRLVVGRTAERKIIEIDGETEAEVRRRLDLALADSAIRRGER